MLCVIKQFFLPLNGKYFRIHFCQHGCLVNTSGANFQYFFVGLYLQQLGLVSNSVWLRNGLPFADGKCPVFISNLIKSAIQEVMPGNIVHGLQHIFIGYALLS